MKDNYWWDEIEKISIGNQNVVSLSLEKILIILCLHGSKHLWTALKWVTDISRLIELQEINWTIVIDQASLLKCQRMVLFGVLLAKHILNSPVPNHILQRAEKDDILMELLSEIQESFYFTNQRGTMAWSIYVIKVQDSLLNRLRCCLRLCLTPTIVDWQELPLPKYLYWLYYLFRPIRLSKWHVWGGLPDIFVKGK